MMRFLQTLFICLRAQLIYGVVVDIHGATLEVNANQYTFQSLANSDIGRF